MNQVDDIPHGQLSGALRRDSVKKNVAAIHVSGKLSLLQRKLSNVLLLNAYDELTTKQSHSIDAKTLCLMIGYNSNDTDTLRAALRSLAETVAEWDMLDKNGKQEWGVSSLLSYAKLTAGVCEYAYSPALAEKLFDPKIFALINLNIQRRFTSGHGLALYENCFRFVRTGSTGWWEIDLFRRLMGVADSAYYESFKHLNAKIIKPAVAEVNKTSNIQLEPEFRKQGRRVSHIRFLIRENPQLAMFEIDDSEGVRNSDVYLALVGQGVSDRLARQWIAEHGEGYVREKLDYVAAKDRAGAIRGSAAQYLSAAIRDDYSEAEPPAPDPEQEAAAKARAAEAAEQAAAEAKKKAEAEAKRQAEIAAKAAEEAKKRAEAAKDDEERKRLEAEAAEAARKVEEEKKKAKAEAEAAAERARKEAEQKAESDRKAREAEEQRKLKEQRDAKEAEQEAATAAAAVVADQGCEDLVQLETSAILGKLSSGTIQCLEESLSATTRMTQKSKINRMLMVNAFSAGKTSEWERLIKRHLNEIEQSDPELCYKYALHLSKKGPKSAYGVIRWANVALENKTVWTGSTYMARVYSLYKIRTAAAQKIWMNLENKHRENPTDESNTKVKNARNQTKEYARAWYEYAKVAGKDTSTALDMCMSAAGAKDYCEAG